MIPSYMLHYYLPIIGARYTRFVQEIRFSNTYIHMDCFTNQITDSIWGSNEWVDIYQIVIDRTWAIVENQLNGTIRTFFAGNNETWKMLKVYMMKKNFTFQVVKMFIVVVIIFAVCWLPYHIYFIYTYHHKEVITMPFIQHVYLGFYWLAMSNAMLNPFIYYWMNARYVIF